MFGIQTLAKQRKYFLLILIDLILVLVQFCDTH